MYYAGNLSLPKTQHTAGEVERRNPNILRNKVEFAFPVVEVDDFGETGAHLSCHPYLVYVIEVLFLVLRGDCRHRIESVVRRNLRHQ